MPDRADHAAIHITMEPTNHRRRRQDCDIRPRWGQLRFQDLGDDEAFLVWAYRCWQRGQPLYAERHALSALLHDERLTILLAELRALFAAFGVDAAMHPGLHHMPLLTWREELLLAMLSDIPETVGVHCDPKAMRCRAALSVHQAQVRHPRHIPLRGACLQPLTGGPCGFTSAWDRP
ncbi:hypothetical protein AAV94_03910 [Lampropedia cohaerens]|uniref:Uncharacterized protein n=2 Tax=Lampropedia cohaerens TaxID=1610491 RepID=A0A0U1Q1N8_9BURK|nr:hypothetical protein AAV94_03910 [Lampropedia cohaerens]